MATPPPSPVLDRDAIAALQTAADDSSSPYRPSSAGAPSVLVFEDTNKRQASPHRPGTSSGPNSPVKKRLNDNISPQRRVTITDEPTQAMAIDGPVSLRLRLDDQQPPPHPNATAIPSITPSPLSQLPDTPMPDVSPLIQQASTSADPQPTAATATAPAAGKTAKNKKKPPSKGGELLDLQSSKVYTFIRQHVFDTEKFTGQAIVDNPQYTDEGMQKDSDGFQKQLGFNFSQKRAQNKNKIAAEPRASRSTAIASLDDNYDVYKSGTTNFQDLSRYILEDLIKCQRGTSFLMCIPTDSGQYWGVDLKKASTKQLKINEGGDKVRISGRQFYCFKVTIDFCPCHDDVVLNTMTNSRFQDLLNDKSGGFHVSLDGVPATTFFVKWWDVLHSPRELMFFGIPFASNRPMDPLFKKRGNFQYGHHIFLHFADQFYGDSKQSALLYAAYMKFRCGIERKLKEEALAREAGIYDRQTLLTPQARDLAIGLDNHCKSAFEESITDFQHYYQPMVLPHNWDGYIDLAKSEMSSQWRIQASYRNIQPRDSVEMVKFKERQVFCQLLTMIRAANFRLLGYWALILTTAFYGWGVRGAAVVANSFWGTTTSRAYRDNKFRELLEGLDQKRKAILRQKKVGLFTFDNIVVVNKLMDQRGRSSRSLHATHMVAHEPVIFDDLTYDFIIASDPPEMQAAPLTFDFLQPASSPTNMHMYETLNFNDTTTGSAVFINHRQIPTSPEPDFTGLRVSSYLHYNRLANDIKKFEYVLKRSDDCFKNIHDSINDTAMFTMKQLFQTQRGKELANSCRTFRQDSVRTWNVAAGLATKSLLLGVVGIDEGDAKGAITCALDLLLKYGMLEEEPNGSWSKPESASGREMMCFGDRCTNENVSAFITTMQDRPMSLEESSIQAEIFLDAITDTQFLPGDWHTSLNMLQSIYKVHWQVLLKPLKDMLKWTRISKDVRGCYYQASKLVTLASNSFKNYLVMAFISAYKEFIDEILSCDEINDEADKITEIVKKFQVWMLANKYSKDEYLKMVTNFVLMTDDFIDFMDSIRRQDGIGIEDGYHCFAPVWKMLGQHKYLQQYFDQLLMNNQDFLYHRRMQQLINRTVRTYDESTGKSALAHDEYLEICNRDLSLMPDVRSLMGRIRQGGLVGPAKRCRRMVEYYYSPNVSDSLTPSRSSSGSKGNQHLEKDLLFEVANLLLGDITAVLGRALEKDWVSRLAEKITTKLKREKLNKEMTYRGDDETTRLFNSVEQVHKAARGHVAADIEATGDDVIDAEFGVINEEENPEEVMESLEIVDEIDDCPDEDEIEDASDDNGIFNKDCIQDLWHRGWNSIVAMKYGEVKKRTELRMARKRRAQTVILNKVKAMKEEAEASVIIDEEKEADITPMWRSVARDHGLIIDNKCIFYSFNSTLRLRGLSSQYKWIPFQMLLSSSLYLGVELLDQQMSITISPPFVFSIPRIPAANNVSTKAST